MPLAPLADRMTAAGQMPATRVAIAAMFFVNGMLFATWVSRIPGVKEALGLGEARLGLALFAMAVGTFSALPLTSWLIARYGSRRVTGGSALACCIAIALVGAAPTLPLLAATLMPFGAALGAMDVAMNAQAASLERAFGRSIMASFHGLWSVGGLIGAGVGGVFAAREVPPATQFLLVAAGLVPIALAAMRRLALDGVAEGPRPSPLAWPSRAVLGVGLVAACGSVVEGGIADWSGVYLRAALGTGTGFATAGFAAFSLAMAIGRFTGDRLIDRFGPIALLRAGATVAAAAMATALLVRSPYLAVAGFAVAGLGVSAVFPIAFSAAGNIEGTMPSAAIAAVATMAYGGGMMGPPFIGFAAGATSLRISLGALVCLCLVISALARNLRDATTVATQPRSQRNHRGTEAQRY